MEITTLTDFEKEYPDKCAIWGTPAKELPSDGDYSIFDSPRAGGKYKISSSARVVVGNLTNQQKALLTTWNVNQLRKGVRLPFINTTLIDNLGDKIRGDFSTYNKAIRFLQAIENYESSPSSFFGIYEYPILIYNVLAYIESSCSGQWLNGSEIDSPSLDAQCYSDIGGIARLCRDLGYIGGKGSGIRLTAKAYFELEEYRKNSSQKNICFVAMWFDDSISYIYDRAIKDAIEHTGYEALRIDKTDHNNKIDDEIILAIKNAHFLIADFTHGDSGPRGGVYYEAGYAHGLGKQVIFTCRKDMIDKIHFDTRQYNHIVWEPEKLDEFKKKLTNRILNTIGAGQNRKDDV